VAINPLEMSFESPKRTKRPEVEEKQESAIKVSKETQELINRKQEEYR